MTSDGATRPLSGRFPFAVVDAMTAAYIRGEVDAVPPPSLLTPAEKAARQAAIDAEIDREAEQARAARDAEIRAAIDADPELVRQRLELLPHWQGAEAERDRVQAIHDVAEHVRRLGARSLADIPTDPPPPLLAGRMAPYGHTILYGTGGCGKGTLTTWWIALLARLGHRVLVLDYENHPEEWARRFDGLAGRDLMDRVTWVAPLAASWTGERGALWAQAGEIRTLAQATGSDIVIVDSIVVACGGADPVDPGTPARYAGALEYIGLPTLSLAHVAKDASLAYPFGSVFWHNLARVTWSLSREDQLTALVMRKANNYAKAGRFAVDVTYWNDKPREVTERPLSIVLGDRIGEVLGDRAMSVEQICAALDELAGDGDTPVKSNSVTVALKRGLAAVPSRFRLDGKLWRLAGEA